MEWQDAVKAVKGIPEFAVKKVGDDWKLACQACQDRIGYRGKRKGSGVVSTVKSAKKHLKRALPSSSICLSDVGAGIQTY